MPSGRHALTPKMGVKEELQNFCLPTGAGNVMSAVGTRNNKSLKVLALGKEKKKMIIKEHLERNLDLAHGC